MFHRGFGSDNHAPIHPEILTAIQKANLNHAPSYGTDEDSALAIETFKKHFGPQTQVHFVFNGTAANVLALRSLTAGFESVLCSDVAHIHQDECAAPEYSAHVKLIPLPTIDGKLKLADLKQALIRRGDQHFSQIKVISLTQPTELGTVYTLAEIKEICDWAHQQKLYVHMDGARLSNAAAFLQTSFHEMTTQLGVDIVSFGGTKNGFLFGEAVLVLNPEIKSPIKFFRKQLGQLPSKTRFLAVQFHAALSGDLWKSIASHSLQKAQSLKTHLEKIPEIKITQMTQSNVVFALIPQAWVKTLRDQYFFYVWNEKTFECRLMTSWDTQDEEILGLATLCQQLSQSQRNSK